MRVSVMQMNPGANKSENIAQARRLIQDAVEQDRPDIVSLPEVWDSLQAATAPRRARRTREGASRARLQRTRRRSL